MTFLVFYNFDATSDFFANPNLPGISTTHDGLDMDIYGHWVSDERRISSRSRKMPRKEIYGSGPIVYLRRRNKPSSETLVRWIACGRITDNMDNVIMCNGTIFIVTDSPSSFPSLGSIQSSADNSHEAPLPREWDMVSIEQAGDILGSYGGFSLNTSTSLDIFRPPRRLFFPNIPPYKGIRLDLSGPIIRRQRSDIGFHPYLLKAAFPLLGLMYQENSEDYALMEVPFVFERLVVADFGVAARSANDVAPFALPLVGLDASKEWWEPIRQNLAKFLRMNHRTQKVNSGQEKTVVTFISRLDATTGSRLRRADHDALVNALETLHESNDFEVNIVSSEGPWAERLLAVAQSTSLVKVSRYDSHTRRSFWDSLADSVFMKPPGRSALMQFFPSDVFTREAETAVRSSGIWYIAWWDDRRFETDSLSPVAPGSDLAQEVQINPASRT
ncbi:hypothetical protein BDR03DRAFT_1009880 [Suillus americanus]|nr:hypothetical protein BDR03DRAFT_1009880 [Suillus americanus]